MNKMLIIFATTLSFRLTKLVLSSRYLLRQCCPPSIVLCLLTGFSVEASEDGLRDSKVLKEVINLARTGEIDFETNIAPIIDKYCTDCHNPVDDEG